MRLPEQDSATGRGIKTGAQAGVGTLVLTALTTLVVSIWNVPGVPDVVIAWAKQNIMLIVGSVGAASGVMGYLWNKLVRKDVKNY